MGIHGFVSPDNARPNSYEAQETNSAIILSPVLRIQANSRISPITLFMKGRPPSILVCSEQQRAAYKG